jgi:hypothetical protein
MDDMGTLQGGASSRALWISKHGAAVGTSKNSAGQDRAVIWQPRIGWECGTVSDLGTLGGNFAVGQQGQRHGPHRRLLRPTSAPPRLSPLWRHHVGLGRSQLPRETGYSEAVGVNNSGPGCRLRVRATLGPDHAWHYGTSQVDITPPGQFTFARGMAINTSGMAGDHDPRGRPEHWLRGRDVDAGGRLARIGVVPTLTESEAYGINDAGDVSGRSFDLPPTTTAGSSTAHGQMIDLVASPHPHPHRRGPGINSAGWIAANATADFDIIEAYILKPGCYANCDASTIPPVLNVADFSCFLNQFARRRQLRQLRQQHHAADPECRRLLLLPEQLCLRVPLRPRPLEMKTGGSGGAARFCF